MSIIATACPLNIDAATLSAYLDGALSPAATAALRDHLPTCATCQGQLAALAAVGALLRRPAPALESTAAQQRRTWLAVQTRITQPKRSFTMPISLSRATVWKGAGTALAAALVITLAWQFVAHGGNRAGTSSMHQPLTPTATPQLPTPEQVWGAQYIKHVQPDNANFQFSHIAPDGSFAVGTIGDQLTVDQGGTIALLNMSTGKVQTLYTTHAGTIGTVLTDGQYVVWVLQPDPSSNEATILAHDLATEQTVTVAQYAASTSSSDRSTWPQLVDLLGFDHNIVLWDSFHPSDSRAAFITMNLVTQQQQTLLSFTPPLNNVPPTAQITWPYIVYGNEHGDTFLYHLPDGKTTPIQTSSCPITFISVNALYCSIVLVNKGHQFTQIQVLRGPDFARAIWQVYYNSPLDQVSLQVNPRVALWFDGNAHVIIWDFTLQRMMTLTIPLNVSLPSVGWDLSGKWFIYQTTVPNSAANIFNIIDTSQLPTK